MAAPFLERVYIDPERAPAYEGFPYGIPFVRNLDLVFKRAVTYLVGENGSGKSTLIEAIAEACGLPVSGGGRNEAADRHGPSNTARLAVLCDRHSVGAPEKGTSSERNSRPTLRRSWTGAVTIRTSIVIHTPDTVDIHFIRSPTAKLSSRSA